MQQARELRATWSPTARAVLAIAALVGLALRLGPVLPAGFPLNDGGMFSVMIRDVQGARFALPMVTSYNGIDIPFAYPPLGFYLGAILADVTGLDPSQILWLLPPLLSVLTLGAFALLARAVLPSPLSAASATLIFAMLPGTYVWEIMGGGLTRAVGTLCALLALREAYRFYAEPRRGPWILLVVFSAATVLAHAIWAVFLAVSVFAVFLAHGRNRPGLVGSAVAAVAILGLTAPWWVTVLGRYGLAPFLSASGGVSWLSFVLTDSDTPLMVALPLALAPLIVFGAMTALGDRRFFLLGWIGLITVVDWRAYSQLVAIPAALGTGYAVGALVARRSRAGDRPPRMSPVVHHVPSVLATLVILWSIYLNGQLVGIAQRALIALSPDDRSAMQWVMAETPQSSTFLIVSGTGWALDRTGEWFPALTGRRSVATVQGTEWIPDTLWKRQEAYLAARDCADRNGVCLDDWARSYNASFTHVYLPKAGGGDCCGPLRAALRSDEEYVQVYDGPGATIFLRRLGAQEMATGSAAGRGAQAS